MLQQRSTYGTVWAQVIASAAFSQTTKDGRPATPQRHIVAPLRALRPATDRAPAIRLDCEAQRAIAPDLRVRINAEIWNTSKRLRCRHRNDFIALIGAGLIAVLRLKRLSTSTT